MKKSKLKRILYLILLGAFCSCNSAKSQLLPIANRSEDIRFKEHIEIDSLGFDNWNNLDIDIDSIPGTSFKRAIDQLVTKNNLKKPVIIAVIDGSQDIESEYLKPYVWKNKKETINNLDDDDNGYIDDINGWNYLGTEDGNSVIFNQYESTRILASQADDNPPAIDKDILDQLKRYNDSIAGVANTVLEQAPFLLSTLRDNYKKIGLTLAEKVTKNKVDSLVKVHNISKEDVAFVYRAISINLSYQDLKSDSLKYKRRLKYYLNLDYNDRENIKNYSANDLSFQMKHGNRYVNSNIKNLYHGTLTAGTIALSLFPYDKLKDKIKIMPLVVSNYGDEHDEDIANAIKYAVDNGAKVINISSAKTFSKYPKLVMEALKYASKKEVLCVNSAGNDGVNMDTSKLYYFPKDTFNSAEEITSNLIKVGESDCSNDGYLKSKISNYGKREVDLFAPSRNILTLSPQDNSNFEVTRGTSFAAPQVSLIASIIFSKYPSLTASEVKQILIDSAVRYDTLVNLPTKENPDQKVPFSELSKSGGIVNAYNALLLAEKVVKEKQ